MKRHPRDSGPAPGAWLSPLIPAAAYVLACRLISRAASALASAAMPKDEARTAAAALASLILLPGAVLWNRRDRLRSCGAAAAPSGSPPLRPALLSAGFGVLLGLAASLFCRAFPTLLPASAPLSGPGWLALLRAVALCVAGPICEETVYRGLVFRRSEALLGPLPAALLSAALFAAGHGSLAQALPAFAAGLGFSGVLLLGRRIGVPRQALVLPILCHAAANAATLALQVIFP